MSPNYYDIGPGWPAFVATFALALAVILLSRSLNKHLRKVRFEAANRAQASASAARPASGVNAEDRDGGGDVVARETDDGE
ncbi:hypothetical protein BKA03_002421 [Demequina lutea]|uniref:Heme exporter protein D n=1 Tax=Demequina lutea TaxID=431489 RepID=A0A7Z0CKX8_9MICO|nr:hypothetical protein [Demequina lutea]